MKRSPTPKEQVLAVHPSAVVWHSIDSTYYVSPREDLIIVFGYGVTPREAWAKAFANMKGTASGKRLPIVPRELLERLGGTHEEMVSALQEISAMLKPHP